VTASTPHRILLIDDDPTVLALLRGHLDGPEFTLRTATTGEDGISACGDFGPDLIVLDVGLPDIMGTEVARRLRAGGFRNPILMLTAMSDEADIVAGLESGAAAYLTKPFRVAEVEAWVRAALRTARDLREDESGTGTEALELDADHRRVRRPDRDEYVRLTPTETLLLGTLMRAGGDLVSRATLLREVWEMDFDPGTTLVEVHVSNLRAKLRRLGADGAVVTVRGEGYRFDPGEL
jgi:DNA-binding response OmpR family regulator